LPTRSQQLASIECQCTGQALDGDIPHVHVLLPTLAASLP
jgi:hypothetical protein